MQQVELSARLSSHFLTYTPQQVSIRHSTVNLGEKCRIRKQWNPVSVTSKRKIFHSPLSLWAADLPQARRMGKQAGVDRAIPGSRESGSQGKGKKERDEGHRGQPGPHVWLVWASNIGQMRWPRRPPPEVPDPPPPHLLPGPPAIPSGVLPTTGESLCSGLAL